MLEDTPPELNLHRGYFFGGLIKICGYYGCHALAFRLLRTLQDLVREVNRRYAERRGARVLSWGKNVTFMVVLYWSHIAI